MNSAGTSGKTMRVRSWDNPENALKTIRAVREQRNRHAVEKVRPELFSTSSAKSARFAAARESARRAHEICDEALQMRERAALFNLVTMDTHMSHLGVAGVPHRARLGIQPDQAPAAIVHFFQGVELQIAGDEDY